MLFVSYWELRGDQSVEERAQALEEQGLMEKANASDLEIIRWDITAAGWGVIIFEADSASDIHEAFDLWRARQPWFEEVKVAPATPVDERRESINAVLSQV